MHLFSSYLAATDRPTCCYDDLPQVFFADFRCPHEVLPVRRAGAERFAATVWYMGPEALPEFWTSKARRSQLEGDHELFAV